MISARKVETGLEVDICLTSPTVYVDYGGLANLANHTTLGNSFRNALLSRNGTLYLSWAHLLELFGLGDGPTYNKFKNYLEGFDKQFVITDCDSGEVIKREKSWKPGHQNPSIDVELIKLVVANWDDDEPLSIAILLRLVESNPNPLYNLKTMHRKTRADLFQLFKDSREKYRRDSETKKKLDQQNYSHSAGTFSTEYLANQLSRQIVMTHEALKLSDGLDYFHAVVPLGYCDHIVLDKQLAARIQRFPRSSPMARVWKIGEIKALTEYLLREA